MYNNLHNNVTSRGCVKTAVGSIVKTSIRKISRVSIYVVITVPILFTITGCPPFALKTIDPHPAAEEGILSTALYIAEKERRQEDRNEMFSSISIGYSKRGEWEKAKELITSITDVTNRSRAQAHLSMYLADDGKINEAETIAKNISSELHRSQALGHAALAYEKAGDFRRGRTIAETIPDPNFQARSFAHIAVHYAREGFGDLSRSIFRQAVTAAEREQSIIHRVETLVFIAVKFREAGRGSDAVSTFNRAVETAAGIRSDQHAVQPWAVILREFPGAGVGSDVIAASEKSVEQFRNTGGFYRDEIVANIAAAYAREKNYGEAERMLAEIGDNASKAAAYARVAVEYIEGRENKRADELFAAAVSLAERIEIPAFKVRTLYSIAGNLVDASRTEAAARLAGTINDPYYSASLYLRIAEKYTSTNNIEKSNELIEKALQSIISAQSLRQQTEILVRASEFETEHTPSIIRLLSRIIASVR